MTHPSAEFLDLQAALAGEYSLQRELGRGGMGIVYLARDVQLDRDVAIKVLPSHLARMPAARERFLREARMAAGLSHPHIVPIHRVSEAGGFVFFVMSYVEGETLGERIRARGPLPPAEATRVLREVAWALAYAHGRGIVHRDVKPDNILLEAGTGRALVTDFGIAHGGTDGVALTELGQIMGTAHFMSPEQAAGERVDGRSDIYALGVVGYLAVSGRLPFESSSNLPGLLVRLASEEPPSVLRVAPGLPPALGAAIDRCLARDSADRFADGEALAEALVPAAETRPPLPAALRAWLASSNPSTLAYLAASGMFGALLIVNLINRYQLGAGSGVSVGDVVLLSGLTVGALVPLLGYHLNQARRLFRAGYTLADLRTALVTAAHERQEGEALTAEELEKPAARLLRAATFATGTWFAATVSLTVTGVVSPGALGEWAYAVPLLLTGGFGVLCNVFEVSLIPDVVRKRIKPGLRDWLWRSRAGGWLARRLGAPERSQVAGPSAFRATEAALGVAASELFAALPKAYRDQLSELPAIVAGFEARAAEARAELEVVANIVPSGSPDVAVLDARKKKAAAQLSESVAALEGIRLDLLRVHAGASDLAPLTTLMDAAREIGEDLGRLAEAQREID